MRMLKTDLHSYLFSSKVRGEKDVRHRFSLFHPALQIRFTFVKNTHSLGHLPLRRVPQFYMDFDIKIRCSLYLMDIIFLFAVFKTSKFIGKSLTFTFNRYIMSRFRFVKSIWAAWDKRRYYYARFRVCSKRRMETD